MSVTRPRRPSPRPTRVRTPAGGGPRPGGLRRRLADQFRPEPRIYRRLAWGFAALAVAFSVAPVVNNLGGWLNKDYDLWYQTGRKFLRGADVYPTDNRLFPFMYPPAAAALLAAVSALGRHGFVWFLLAAQSASWAGAVLLSVRLATGKALGAKPVLYLVPSLCVIPFVHDMYLLGQPNLLLLFLMLAAFACLRGGRPVSAGALVALAAGVKAFPVMALGYLVYRRQWKATAAAVVTLAALLLALPAAFRGPEKAWGDMAVWTKGMVLKYDEGGIAQRPERCYSFKNQSLVGVANRLLRDIPADGEKKDGWKVNLAALDFKAVNRVVAAVGLGLCLFYVGAMPPRCPGPDGSGGRAFASETAMLLLLILVFSPFAFNYFYVWLIYPLTVVLHRLLEADSPRDRLWLGGGLAVALAAYAATAVSLRGAQAYGNLLAVDLILLGLLGGLLLRDRFSRPEPAA